jgi:hypothetical protein
VQGGYGACFCIHGSSFVELEPLRGTSFIGARNLSPVTKLLAGTGAVSRYNVGRSRRFVTVQEIKLRATARIRMQGTLEICLDAGARQKP